MSAQPEDLGLFNAFVPGERIQVAATGQGPLDGLRFAVKDLIDVAGVTTGGGNPDWFATHMPAAVHAPSVASLLAAGASVDGKAITDELAYSLEGENVHYGTPVNPRWPWALPGGSSSGSAVAVACGAVDFALGTDTGGSVRVPAAFCGLWGIRPTHDAVSPAGVLPFAPCFDTVGWFARSAQMLEAVGQVLLSGEHAGHDGQSARASSAGGVALEAPRAGRHEAAHASKAVGSKGLIRFDEAFAAREANEPRDAARLREIAASLGARTGLPIFEGQREQCLQTYQQLQDSDIRASLGGWIGQTQPRFGPSIAARFARLTSLDETKTAGARLLREQWREKLDAMLATHYLVLPTTPLSLLSKTASADTIGRFYGDALTMNAIAAFGGYPQLTVPFTDSEDRPLALSIVGARGDDLALLAFVQHLDVSLA
jgi:amidase